MQATLHRTILTCSMQVTVLHIHDRSKANMEKPANFKRSACAIANTLDLVGDRWSLLVIRDLLSGKRTYSELLASPERIPTNILADRLKRLEGAGIIVSAVLRGRRQSEQCLAALGTVRCLHDELGRFVEREVAAWKK
jgi:DNA-binding HxlR family transcriptional regulator